MWHLTAVRLRPFKQLQISSTAVVPRLSSEPPWEPRLHAPPTSTPATSPPLLCPHSSDSATERKVCHSDQAVLILPTCSGPSDDHALSQVLSQIDLTDFKLLLVMDRHTTLLLESNVANLRGKVGAGQSVQLEGIALTNPGMHVPTESGDVAPVRGEALPSPHSLLPCECRIR